MNAFVVQTLLLLDPVDSNMTLSVDYCVHIQILTTHENPCNITVSNFFETIVTLQIKYRSFLSLTGLELKEAKLSIVSIYSLQCHSLLSKYPYFHIWYL